MSARFKTIESDPDDLIPLAAAAKMLGLDPSTIRKRKAGTETLTIIPQGKKFFMIRGEIIAHRQKLVEDARRRTDIFRIVGRAK
jgi:hypothetical protein